MGLIQPGKYGKLEVIDHPAGMLTEVQVDGVSLWFNANGIACDKPGGKDAGEPAEAKPEKAEEPSGGMDWTRGTLKR